jgi:hypothetical protein
MRFVTRLAELSLDDLKAVAAGQMEFSVSDMEFLETLGAHGCLVLSPWVVRLGADGMIARVTPVVFDENGNIDKIRVLIGVARVLRRPKKSRPNFGARFSSEG